ncbi:MAG: transcriptional repressor NrdR [Schwartzia sp.]|nr:transcriptional repressor NrdR [Schwartzia sp. (in: firmicutes)]MDO4202921.1 transcriptional regulator NrdR [Selenomonadaceae bacterium]
MRCPFCKAKDSKVIDSRSSDDDMSIRRRRECMECGRRFTTYEEVEQVPLMVIKNDGRRVAFDSSKILNGLIRSCDKRNIPMDEIMKLSRDIERSIRNSADREITTNKIGELVMDKLRDFDEVAYIRFASVYRKFADITMFRDELEQLLNRSMGK